MNRRVLVVDDEIEQIRLYRRFFEANGLEVGSAASSYEALGLVHGAEDRPDLILCDIAMPGLDGVALVKALHAAPETASIPVILMTGLGIPKSVLEIAAETLGVGPVFIKGGELDSLLARVTALLRSSAPRRRGVFIDPVKRAAWIDDVRLPELPGRRFQLLCALLRRPGAVSREALLEQVWDAQDNLNVVDVTVLRLRQDLKEFPSLRIETVPDGYRLVVDGRPGRCTPPG